MTYIDEIAQAIQAALPADVRLPKSDTDRLFRLYAVLALAKGVQVTTEDIHDAWAAWECDRRPDSRSIVPFDHLAPAVQQLDEPFVEAIRRVARGLRSAASS